MAVNTSYQFHNFPKLAEESGFVFNSLRPRVRVDWNRIRSIDIESLIRDRKFYLIEQHISDIVSCALDSEFDVRILDTGVIKMFRLAQLAVEYQEFCRHYLDRSINILREEITALVQELDNCRKMLRERDDEIKRMRRKTKHTYRPPLPYGNDNIATMILKTLTNKSDVFQSTANPDTRAYNRCNYCDKVFLNQLYLKSHVARRHPGMDVAEKENPDQPIETANTSTEKVNDKLNEEIKELKSKLQQMENVIANTNMPNTESHASYDKNQQESQLVPHDDNQQENKEKKITKDAEVSTNNEDYVLEKIEEWKKEEYEKYNKEINLLRTQIIDTIQSLKENEPQKETSSIEHLHITIQQQVTEIHALKQELSNSKLIMEKEEIERRKGSEAQMLLLAQRTEIQSKQYESLLQKLNEVAKEAQESRALAEKERERATQLQELLQSRLNNKISANPTPVIDKKTIVNGTVKTPVKKLPSSGSKSLESLHRKAQELLNIGSSSSDISNESAEIETQSPSLKKRTESLERKSSTEDQHTKEIKAAVPNKIKAPKLEPLHNKHAELVKTRLKKPKTKQIESEHNRVDTEEHTKNDLSRKHGSPVKLVRSKITEEVNNRLVSIGVDPLKNSLPQSVFKKHRMNFQQQNDNKAKKNPAYLKVRHTILTYLDSKTALLRDNTSDIQEYASPSKLPRTFSISSVLSNVKSKALSLVKTNEANVLTRRKNEISRKNASTKSSTESESSQEVPRNMMTNVKNILNVRKQPQNKKITNGNGREDISSDDSDNKYHNSAITEATTKSIESLIKSPARRPSSANAAYGNNTARKLISNKEAVDKDLTLKNDKENEQSSSTMTDEDESTDAPIKKAVSVDNIQSIPKTKGVLKNASSTSSLNKKKVLFDMDAIQMKSVSASPSQSINEKADSNEKFELGLINLEAEDWDISSIDNEHLNNDTKINVNLRTSPKIAELRQSIENQLAHRKETTTALIGGVDVLKGPPVKVPSVTGSNTSLGSSILDESDGPPIKTNAFVKSKRFSEKNDSDLDTSENSIDGMLSNKKNNDSF